MMECRSNRWSDDRGEATVEFIGLVAVLVIPIVYLVVALAQIQAGLFAVEAGAREAARVLAEDPGASQTAAAQQIYSSFLRLIFIRSEIIENISNASSTLS